MTDIRLDDLQPVNNPEHKRFEIRLGEEVAMIEYLLQGANITMHHTEVPPAFEGKGIAGKLAKFALDWAQENGYKVNALCPYVKGYVAKHPEYHANVWGF
jgi:predicted GNAT family acetyltransferase